MEKIIIIYNISRGIKSNNENNNIIIISKNDKSKFMFHKNFLKEKKEIYKSKKVISMSYRFNPKTNLIKILGNEFINNNKEKCKIIMKNKIFKLKKFIQFKDKSNIKSTVKVKLIIFANLFNISMMFNNCVNLQKITYFFMNENKKFNDISGVYQIFQIGI